MRILTISFFHGNFHGRFVRFPHTPYRVWKRKMDGWNAEKERTNENPNDGFFSVAEVVDELRLTGRLPGADRDPRPGPVNSLGNHPERACPFPREYEFFLKTKSFKEV